MADLGIIALRKGDYAGAETLFRQSLEGQYTHPELHNLLGVALESQGDLEGAAAEYLKALELFEGFKIASDNLARVREKKQK